MKKDINNNVLYTYGMLVLGIILGSLFLLISVTCGHQYLLDFGLEDFDVTVLSNAPEFEIVVHVLKKRSIQLLIFILLSILTTYSVSTIVYCGSFGVYYGIVICNLILKYGILGLGYGVVCFFPHFMLYLFIIYLIGMWRENVAFRNRNYYGNVTKIQIVVKIVLIIIMFSAAIIWEIQFQKIF